LRYDCFLIDARISYGQSKKDTVIHAAADRMAANYKSSQIPMYGDALRMPNRNAVIEIIRDCQKLIFPVYYGDREPS